jgi:hypothetical protein
MKKCSKCLTLQSLNAFSPNKKAKDKLASWCKKCCVIINKIYKDTHKEQEKQRTRLYKLKNKAKIKENSRKYSVTYRKNRYNEDPLFKLIVTIRNRLGKFIRRKNQKTLNIIGCSKEKLFYYIESQFHIIPLSSAKTEEELYKLCHYTNLQPLWAIDNLKKSNKIE